MGGLQLLGSRCVGRYDVSLPTSATLLQWLSVQYISWKIEGFRPRRKRKSGTTTAHGATAAVRRCLERLWNNHKLGPLRMLLEVQRLQTIAEGIVQKHSAGHAASVVYYFLSVCLPFEMQQCRFCGLLFAIAYRQVFFCCVHTMMLQ